MMRRLASVVLMLALVAGVQTAWAQGASAQVNLEVLKESPRSISVSGRAEVNVVPDEVVISLGVETSDLKLSVAKAQNDKAIAQVLDLAKRYGIEAKHVKTDHITVEPRYDDTYAKKGFVGYFVRKGVEITLKDVAKFDGFLSDALESGVTNVHGIEFKTTELRKHKDTARLMAIQAAKEKAVALTAALGQSVGRPTHINENSGGWYYGGYNGWGGGGYGRMMAQNMVQNVGGSGSSGGETTALGQIKVDAEVTVTFEMEAGNR